MNLPYSINSTILKNVSAISERLGEVKTYLLNRPSPQLRKQNKIKTIQASLQIEGNTLSVDQVSAIINDKRVIGPENEIREVKNANRVYKRLSSLNAFSEKDFLKAHKLLMEGLIEHPGTYRSSAVGIAKGKQLTHIAPPASAVPKHMKSLFKWLNKSDELTLIKSCVFHYEVEFIHPFLDGNGRMGRLWQTAILMKTYPVFEFLPFETLIRDTQTDYYAALAQSDKKGNATPFIEYITSIILESLDDLLNFRNQPLSASDRLDYFVSLGISPFSRKDYMQVFKQVSTATASRDLKKGVEEGLIKKSGDKAKTIYQIAIG